MSLQIHPDDVSDGDLGLGDGLKPGGLPVIPDFDKEFNGKSPHISSDKRDTASPMSKNCTTDVSSHSGFTTPEDSDDEFEVSLMPIAAIQKLKTHYSYLNTPSTRRSQEIMPLAVKDDFYDERYIEGPKKNDSSSNYDKSDDNGDRFPVYADVPYGTSIRQQKELFKHNMEGLKKKKDVTSSGNGQVQMSKSPPKKKRTGEEIAMKLAETLQEVEDLKVELDTCEHRLDSKYQAIDILRLQAQEAQSEQRLKDMANKETTKKLAQEINRLQFDLHWKEISVLDSEQVWAQRFDRMCQDNRALMEALDVRTEELRKVKSQKIAVQRENDELLALLDVQERAKYARTRSMSSEENYCNFTSTELAVLGACRCRISKPDPCGCAMAAANLKRDIVKLKEQLKQYKTRRDEAFLTVDAYRKAFEEQLQKNKSLTLQFSQLSCNNNSPSRHSRGRSALKWLIGSLNDEELSDEITPSSSSAAGPSMSDADLINYLTEMLQEKKEVLAHQRLASQILADRVRVLEEKLVRTDGEEEEEGVFPDQEHG